MRVEFAKLVRRKSIRKHKDIQVSKKDIVVWER